MEIIKYKNTIWRKPLIYSIVLLFLILSTYAIAQNGKDWQSTFSKSYDLESKKNYKEAINTMMTIYQDNNYEINLRLGWLYYNSKDYKKSMDYYKKAISIRQNSIEAKFGFILPASALKNWDNVFEQYQEILKIDNQNTKANYWVGMIHYNRSNFSKALEHFKIVANLYPFDADANLMAGWAELKLGKKDEAKRYFEVTLLIQPNNSSALEGLKYVK
jgi:tetratricopeptide (TPR) repeat protein